MQLSVPGWVWAGTTLASGGGALEARATFWPSITARRVSEDLFLTEGLYFLFDRALFLFYVEASVL